jgi:hypothetical protein
MNKMDKEKVVITTPLRLYYNPNDGSVWAARFEELGLTAYGSSEHEATVIVKKMLNRFVNAYRNSGQLESRLNQVGVRWHWAKDYPTDAPQYEDTNMLFRSAVAASSSPHRFVRVSPAMTGALRSAQSEQRSFVAA